MDQAVFDGEGRLEVEGPYDLAATFSLLGMGGGDPCLRLDAPQQMRLALQTNDGPVVFGATYETGWLQLRVLHGVSTWRRRELRALFGLDYHPPGIAEPRKLCDLARRFQGMRIVKLPAVSLRLVQIILQQLITFHDACAGWRSLVRRYGEPIPACPDMRLPPDPRTLARLVSYQFRECGVLPDHGRRIVAAMRHAARLESVWDRGAEPDAADRICDVLDRITGIGPWTMGFLRGAGMGDADALVPGDYGHPKQVSLFFDGREQDDDQRMIELLEPYRPHRFWTLALLVQGAPRPPRRGPRRRSVRDRMRLPRR